MLLLDLIIENFGVFRGKHSFDLTPRSDSDFRRHLLLVTGHNGAGKSTIFQAMRLALHGSSCPGEMFNGRGYQNFLSSRLHYYPQEVGLTEPQESGVALRFQYVRSGQFMEISVARRWKKQVNTIQETLHVLQDGQPPDVAPDDYQAWLDDFISPGMGSLCFFDAEQLDALVSPDRQSDVLRDTLARLLGLDLVERLEFDLNQLTYRQGSTKKIGNLHTKVLELRSDRDKLDEQLALLSLERDGVISNIATSEDEEKRQERLLAAEGGMYAARRPILQDRLRSVQKEVDTLSNQLRELCADLLPFSLAPGMCIKLYKRLLEESKIRRQLVLNSLLQEKLPELEKSFAEDEIWKSLNLSSESRKYLVQQLSEKLCSLGTLQLQGKTDIVHHLSEIEQQQVIGWIYQILRDVPKHVQSLGSKLRRQKKEQRQIEADLQRAPDDEILAPIHAEIARINEYLTEKRKRLNTLNSQIAILQSQRGEKHKLLEEAIEQHTSARKFEKQLMYAERSRNVLRTYKDALTRQKLQEIEDVLVDRFNKLCRKEHLLSGIQIDPETFAVHLEGSDGAILRLSDFSAGERQIYALALLWALRLVSKLPLPLAIDTPLARLDDIHRSRFAHGYIPFVSDQVLLFATNAEVDQPLLTEVNPYISRYYQLNHDSHRRETTVVARTATSSEVVDIGSLPKEKVDIHVF